MSICSYIQSFFASPTLTLVIPRFLQQGPATRSSTPPRSISSTRSTTPPRTLPASISAPPPSASASTKTSSKKKDNSPWPSMNGEEIVVTFQKNPEDPKVEMKWRFVRQEARTGNQEKRFYELTFKKIVKLYNAYTADGRSSSIDLDHPATFETLAMDPKLKQEIKDDLDRFKSRKEFYKKVGKSWKRGYLLYGPPGTGKSSLVAAMANYLKFDIYDLELTSISCNSDLRKFTLSGLLNFIDGLWSSCGDERIIVFTTNDKDQLDPALLRPGRMDKRIEMSYCTKDGFKVLAYNYLGIEDGDSHELYGEIEGIIESKKVTPAEVAEKLMTSVEVDDNLKELAKFLEIKQVESNEIED
uniref:AAA+ ATPase domain-containing protein n=1 Tax=Fagus sylvatica TaxID=28930 RepID=A0A2N9IB00_FAGSY